jgi:hypothetical protein
MTTPNGRDLTFHIPNAVTLEGGYNASTGTRDITTNLTTLSGDIGTVGTTTDNCYHVVLTSTASSNTTSKIQIDGFAITAGNANANTSITVNGNSVYRNYGGGIYTNYGTPTVTNNTIYSNSATCYSTTTGGDGGGGAGIYTNYGTPTVTNNTIYSNSANGEGYGKGGGIHTNYGTPTVTNNTIYNNSALFGGGIYTKYSTSQLTNNTLYSNSATNSNGAGGGGIHTDFGTNILTNNIFWQNKKGTNPSFLVADYSNESSTNTLKNNLMQLQIGAYTEEDYNGLGTSPSGNLFKKNPLFVSTTVGAINLRLQATSPCINAGTAAGAPTTDITGAKRTGNPDMGAYEY